MKLILAISGKSQNGKTTLSNNLEVLFNNIGVSTERIAFADPLKNIVKHDFGVTKDGGTCNKNNKKSFSDILYSVFTAVEFLRKKYSDAIINETTLLSACYEVAALIFSYNVSSEGDRKIISRIILQKFGTEVCRYFSNEKIWVDKLIENINSSNKDIVIVDDLRFINEATSVKEYFGDRLKIICIWRDVATQYNHQSENEVEKIRYMGDFFIDNTGDMESLSIKVAALFKIIQKLI